MSFCVCVAQAGWWGDGLISAPVSAIISLIVSQQCNEIITFVIRCLQRKNRVGFLTSILLVDNGLPDLLLNVCLTGHT